MSNPSRTAGSPGIAEPAREAWMRAALREAEKGAAAGEIPVGAVVVSPEWRILSRAHNRPVTANDPTAHAEILALRSAARRIGNYRLTGCRLVVTLEPCPMCAGAAVVARVEEIIYGAPDPKGGAVSTLYRIASDPRLNHRAAVTSGVLAEECAAPLTAFFRSRR
ncbi:MAG TPA: tRNA adenosine(34) deaminase TadA [Candidatus Binatia bacterium]|nr:tRNA adenosine(34) deaminase TadA [Candidatus Binatia bacterium]